MIEDNTFPLGSFDPSEVNGYEDIGSGVRYGTWDRARGRFDGRDHWDLKANISHYAGNILGGTHELKGGIHREKGWTQRWNVIPNNLLLRLSSAPTCLSLSCAVPLDVALHAGPTDTQDEYVIYAGYVQDQFTLPQGVTINADCGSNTPMVGRRTSGTAPTSSRTVSTLISMATATRSRRCHGSRARCGRRGAV